MKKKEKFIKNNISRNIVKLVEKKNKNIYRLKKESQIISDDVLFSQSDSTEMLILKLFMGILAKEYSYKKEIPKLHSQQDIADAIKDITGHKSAIELSQASISNAFSKYINQSAYEYDGALHYLVKVAEGDCYGNGKRKYHYEWKKDETYLEECLMELSDIINYSQDTIWVNDSEKPTEYCFVIEKDNIEKLSSIMDAVFKSALYAIKYFTNKMKKKDEYIAQYYISPFDKNYGKYTQIFIKHIKENMLE